MGGANCDSSISSKITIKYRLCATSTEWMGYLPLNSGSLIVFFAAETLSVCILLFFSHTLVCSNATRLNQLCPIAVTGKPHRTQRGELSLEATELPRLLSPCLHDVPLDREEPESSPYSRLVQFLNHNKLVHVIRARSAIIQYLRQFLLDRSFMEVNTPILSSTAGGAIARPFYTSATEFPERQLSLRIAPELWLKRFVVGGFDRVFEIGPSFRNEGECKRCGRMVEYFWGSKLTCLQALIRLTIPSLQHVNSTMLTPIWRTSCQ